MKISVNDVELYTLTDTQKKVIMDYLPAEIFEEDMKRRLQWILTHLYDEAFKKLKSEWEPRLAAKGVDSLPTNPDKLAELIFSQGDYRDRSARDRGE